jgi:hypothetical protein
VDEAVPLKQLDAAVIAGGVGDPGADQVAEDAGGDGTGRQADSSAISTKTAGRPVEEMKSVQTLMIGSRIRSLMLARTMLAINMVVAAGPG